MFDVVPRRRKSEGEVQSFRKEVEDLFETFFSGFPVRPFEGLRRSEWRPQVDVTETDEVVTVKAEIPGMEAKDIEVSLSGNMLTIQGEKKQEKEEKNESYHRVERSYGKFRRDIELPAEVVAEKISATHKNGILKIQLPKSAREKKEEVKVKIN